MIRATWLFPILLTGTSVLAACSSANKNQASTSTRTSATRAATVAVTATPALGSAQAQLCSSLSALSTALQPLENIGSGATVSQVVGSRDAIQRALNDVVQAAKNVTNAATTPRQSAADSHAVAAG